MECHPVPSDGPGRRAATFLQPGPLQARYARVAKADVEEGRSRTYLGPALAHLDGVQSIIDATDAALLRLTTPNSYAASSPVKEASLSRTRSERQSASDPAGSQNSALENHRSVTLPSFPARRSERPEDARRGSDGHVLATAVGGAGVRSMPSFVLEQQLHAYSVPQATTDAALVVLARLLADADGDEARRQRGALEPALPMHFSEAAIALGACERLAAEVTETSRALSHGAKVVAPLFNFPSEEAAANAAKAAKEEAAATDKKTESTEPKGAAQETSLLRQVSTAASALKVALCDCQRLFTHVAGVEREQRNIRELHRRLELVLPAASQLPAEAMERLSTAVVREAECRLEYRVAHQFLSIAKRRLGTLDDNVRAFAQEWRAMWADRREELQQEALKLSDDAVHAVNVALGRLTQAEAGELLARQPLSNKPLTEAGSTSEAGIILLEDHVRRRSSGTAAIEGALAQGPLARRPSLTGASMVRRASATLLESKREEAHSRSDRRAPTPGLVSTSSRPASMGRMGTSPRQVRPASHQRQHRGRPVALQRLSDTLRQHEQAGMDAQDRFLADLVRDCGASAPLDGSPPQSPHSPPATRPPRPRSVVSDRPASRALGAGFRSATPDVAKAPAPVSQAGMARRLRNSGAHRGPGRGVGAAAIVRRLAPMTIDERVDEAAVDSGFFAQFGNAQALDPDI